jgi:hypothetical protein
MSYNGYFDGNTIKTFDVIEAPKNQKVIITFLDEFVEMPTPPKKKTAQGALKEYAKTDMDIHEIMELERAAWEEAAVEKHENFRR